MMDFLDPKKSRAHTIRLLTGYVLMAVALVLATSLLLDLANGFGVKQGKVIQNGLVFINSSPSGSDITMNGKLQDSKTNARLLLPSGTYTMRVGRDGYRDWQRALTVEGGSVNRFDYPLLVPKSLATAIMASYADAPPLTTQSPDRRWLIVQQPGSPANFDVYDIKDPKKVKSSKKTISLPAAVPSLPLTAQSSFKVVEWSNDNDHVLLLHSVGEQMEYLLVSRNKPEESVNVTRQLQLSSAATVSLQDKKYNRYFVFDAPAETLSTAELADSNRTTLLKGVLNYKTYGDNVVVYATTEGASQGKVAIKLYQNDKSYSIRQIAQDSLYLLDISRFSGSWYIVVGSPAEDHVYIYKDPASMLDQAVPKVLVPVEVLKLDNPDYVGFSANSKFIMAESSQDVTIFDVDSERNYTHQLSRPLDVPQTHVTWMDGYHLRYIADGLVSVVDYDGTNLQTLSAAGSAYVPLFDTGYTTSYNLAPASNPATAGQFDLTATPLLVTKDQ